MIDSREDKAAGDGRIAIDIGRNRRGTKYSRGEQLQRSLWVVGQLLFRIVPRPFYGARASLLRLFGADVGPRCQIYPTVRIFLPSQLHIGGWTAIGDGVKLYNLGSIRIGQGVTISQGAHLCAGSHNYADPTMPLVRAEIEIGDSAWICADAFIGPEVKIGHHAVVGARAVVMRSVEAEVVVGGNPAQVIKSRNMPVAGRREWAE